MHNFFDKFHAAIMKLEIMDACLSDVWVFDIFYSTLFNVWKSYIQKKIEEVQEFKSILIILNIHLFMKKIRSWLNPLKDKKPAQSSDTMANSVQLNTTAADLSILILLQMIEESTIQQK